MRKIWFPVAMGIFVLLIFFRLRSSPFIAPPQLYGYLHLTSGIMALTFAVISLLRFRSDQDRFSLFLGLAFLLSGIAVLLTIPGLFGDLGLFAFLLIAAAFVGRRVSTTIHPIRESVLALLIAVGVGALATTIYQWLPASWAFQPIGAVRRPVNLVLALVFLVPAIDFGRRFKKTGLPSDAGIFLAAMLNVASHIISSESQKSLDAAFMVAEGFKTMGYAAAVGGMLVQSAKLYEEVRSLAIMDSLTGLANHRFLAGVIESEIHRSMRAGHPFTVLLLDLDGLKKINDRYGHATGSQALCRLADVLRIVCRGTDTAGRYGGDEFVVVLPETGEESAQRVRDRIRAQLANDSVFPPLSVSIGLAVYPVDG